MASNVNDCEIELFELDDARKRFFPSVSKRQCAKFVRGDVRGVRLATLRLGGKSFVSRDAVRAFVDAIFADLIDSASRPATRRKAKVFRADDGEPVDAYSKLAALGVKWTPSDLKKRA